MTCKFLPMMPSVLGLAVIPATAAPPADRTNLSRADMTGTAAEECDFTHADLTGTRLQGHLCGAPNSRIPRRRAPTFPTRICYAVFNGAHDLPPSLMEAWKGA